MNRLKKFTRLLMVAGLFIVRAPLPAVALPDGSVDWQPWSDKIFTEAKASHKLVLLDLESVWCHWCHVMDEKTYRDPKVRSLLAEHYLAVKVDQDARPDLANRYRDYGWPATILFDANGRELAKLAGFVEPAKMAVILEQAVAKPAPAAEEAKSASEAGARGDELIAPAVVEELRARQYRSHDDKLGGLKTGHKYLDSDSVEYALIQAALGESKDRDMADRTLNANLKLLDPVWGGVYQYSTNGDWDHPHFEKIVPSQAVNLRIYSLAAAEFSTPAYEKAAREITRYVKNFLTSSEGAFYTSQDADLIQGEHSAEYFALDDAGRRARGMPRIDSNKYSRENGMLISSLAVAYAAFGDEEILAAAIKAANWILANRLNADGGFRHGENAESVLYLGDSLYTGAGLLDLYAVTADTRWLTVSRAAGTFVEKSFGTERGDEGFLTATKSASSPLKPIATISENIAAARYLNLLYQYTGDATFYDAAKKAVRYLGRKDIALESIVESGILLAQEEVTTEPLHVTVVAKKNDESGKKLFREVLRYFSPYKRTEWWDKSEGPLMRNDVQYPEFPKAAAYICTNTRCSSPIFDANQVQPALNRLTKRKV